ncbi:MAG: hypothetical protein WBF06_03970 [Candidatus Acidiferrales bacterium]
MNDNPLTQLGSLGQTMQLDYIRRDLISRAGFRRVIRSAASLRAS